MVTSWLDVGQSNGHAAALVLSSTLALPSHVMSVGDNSLKTVTAAALGQTEDPPA